MYSNNKYYLFISLLVFLIINCNSLVSSTCDNCKDTLGSVCSSNKDCFSGYCNSTGICVSFIPCTSTNATNDDCPVDSNNFMCFRNNCIPTTNQVAPAPCKTNSNCATNKCSNNKCMEDICGKNSNTFFSNYCKWTNYCYRVEFPNQDPTFPPTVSYVCRPRDNDGCDSVTPDNCLPGYKCSISSRSCLPNFSGTEGMQCINKLNGAIDSLTFCDIGSGLVCQDNSEKNILLCSKYDDSIKTCIQDSDCALSPFEKCSCEGKCISKYNLNSECKDSINKAYQCSSSKDSPIFTNSFYTNCSKESCDLVKKCVKKEYDSTTCHQDSLYMCPSFDWSDPETGSNSTSQSSSSTSNSTNQSSSSEFEELNSSITIFELLNISMILSALLLSIL